MFDNGIWALSTMDEYIDPLFPQLETPGPLQDVVRNIMDELISEAVKERLLRPHLPKKYQPRHLKEEGKKQKAIEKEFDPVLKQKIRTVEGYQNEAVCCDIPVYSNTE